MDMSKDCVAEQMSKQIHAGTQASGVICSLLAYTLELDSNVGCCLVAYTFREDVFRSLLCSL